jgi:hypothetical protein
MARESILVIIGVLLHTASAGGSAQSQRDLTARTVLSGWSAFAGPAATPHQSAAKKVTEEACRPTVLHDFCRVGCREPEHAVETRHVEPSVKDVHRPLPSGVVILEVGVDLTGKVVSACVMRGVRHDFDKAAQAAALAGQWKIPAPSASPRLRGYVLTITECTPDKDCKHRPPISEK